MLLVDLEMLLVTPSVETKPRSLKVFPRVAVALVGAVAVIGAQKTAPAALGFPAVTLLDVPM
jgi:hypothetical protein